MHNSSKILLFRVAPAKTVQIKALCQSLKIQVLTIRHDQYHRPLGQLAGIKGFASPAPATTRIQRSVSTSADTFGPLPGIGIPRTELMVFCGFSSDALDAFLEAYKQAQIAPIPLKAVITPANIGWDAHTLYTELLKEHAQFKSRLP